MWSTFAWRQEQRRVKQRVVMNVEQVLNEFKKSGALLEGHFILSSGLHSDKFLQKALVFQDAKRTAKLCKALAAKVKKEVKDEITAIVSPAVGGIVPGYEMGRQLGLPAMYVERVDGEFQLRRNFTLKKGQKVLMVEDIVSTGVSSRECIAAIKKTGAKVVAACCLIDRSGGKAKVGVPLIALAEWKVQAWPADKLPPHLRNMPARQAGEQRAGVSKLRLGRQHRSRRHGAQCARRRQSRSGARRHPGAGRGRRRHHGASARRPPPYLRRRYRTR